MSVFIIAVRECW